MVSFIEKYNEHLNFVAQCDHKPGASLSICLSSRGGRGGWRRSRRRRGERLHLDQQPGRVSLGRWVSSFQSQGWVFRTFSQSGESLDSVHDGLFLVQKDPLRSSFGHFWSFAEWNEPFPYLVLALAGGGEQFIAASIMELILIRWGKNGRIWKEIVRCLQY